MLEEPAIDWEEVYASFDGTMPECLGSECPQVCCGLKPMKTTRGVTQANTTMAPDEFRYQEEQLSPSLTELGVVGHQRYIVKRKIFGFEQIEERVLIQGCLDPETGECRLKDRKPTICRVRPLETDYGNPYPGGCPRGAEILANPKTRAGVCRLGVAMGLMDEDEVDLWEMHADKHLALTDK